MPVWSLPEEIIFPHPLSASGEGILAIGGDLSLERLILAYAYGIFPWYGEDEPIIWWFPDPRCAMKPEDVYISKTMRALLRKAPYKVTFDTCFADVIRLCKDVPRKRQPGTWIQPEIVDAYVDLHEAGYAHSVEIWKGGTLVGGLYGVAYGRVFFGESMFSLESNASKYALIILARNLEQREFDLIDCQQNTSHLRSMGATPMPAKDFHTLLQRNRLRSPSPGKWQYDPSLVHLPS